MAEEEHVVISVEQQGADQAASGIGRVADAADQAAGSTDKLSASQAGASSALKETGAAAQASGSNLSFLQQQMAQLSSVGNGVALALKSVATAATGSLVASLGSYQDSLRQTEGSLQVLLHSAEDAKQAMTDLVELSGRSGSSVGDLKRAYADIYNSSAADGTEGAKSLLTTLQDLNTVYLTGPKEGAEVIRDLARAMKDGSGWSEVYDKALNQAPGIALAMENAFHKSGDSLKTFLQAAQQDSGALEKQLSGLQARLALMSARGGDTPVERFRTDQIKKQISDVEDQLALANKDIAATFGQWAQDMSGNIAAAAEKTALTGDQMAARLKQSFLNAESAIASSIFGGGGDANSLGQQAFTLLIQNIDTVTRLANIGAVALTGYFAPFVGGSDLAGVLGMAAALLQFGETTDTASKAALVLGSALAGWNALGPVGGVIGGLTALIVTNRDAVDQWIASVSGGQIDGLGGLFDVARAKASGFFSYVSGQANAAGQSLETAFSGALDTVGSVFKKIKQAALDGWTFVTETWSKLPDFLQDMIRGIGVTLAGAKIGEMLGLSPTQGAALAQLFDLTMRNAGGYEKLGEAAKSARDSVSGLMESAAPAAKQASASIESEASKLAAAKSAAHAASRSAMADSLADYYSKNETIHLGSRSDRPSAGEDEGEGSSIADKAAATLRDRKAALQGLPSNARDFVALAAGAAISDAKAKVSDLTSAFGGTAQAAASLSRPLDDVKAKSEQVASWWDKIKIQMFAMLATGSFDPIKLVLASNAAEGLTHINELTKDISHGLNDMQREEAVSVATFAGYSQGGIAGAAMGWFGAKLATTKQSLSEMAAEAGTTALRLASELGSGGPIGVALGEMSHKFAGMMAPAVDQAAASARKVADDWGVSGVIGQALNGLLGLFDQVGQRSSQAAQRASQGVSEPNKASAGAPFLDRAADQVNQAYESAKLFASGLFQNPTGGAALTVGSAPFTTYTAGAQLYPPASNDNASLWRQAQLERSVTPQGVANLGVANDNSGLGLFASAGTNDPLTTIARNTDLMVRQNNDNGRAAMLDQISASLTSQNDVYKAVQTIPGMSLDQGSSGSASDISPELNTQNGLLRDISASTKSMSSDASQANNYLGDIANSQKMSLDSYNAKDQPSGGGSFVTTAGLQATRAAAQNKITNENQQRLYGSGYVPLETDVGLLSAQMTGYNYSKNPYAGDVLPQGHLYAAQQANQAYQGGLASPVQAALDITQQGIDLQNAPQFSALLKALEEIPGANQQLFQQLLASKQEANPQTIAMIQTLNSFGGQINTLQGYLDSIPDGPWKQPMQNLVDALMANTGVLRTATDSFGHISAFGYSGQYTGAVPADVNQWGGAPQNIASSNVVQLVSANAVKASTRDTSKQSAGSNVTVNMTVNGVSDPNSFNASQEQIMAGLAYAMQHAVAGM
ncbi:hypothetical protein QM467_04785 [Rhodoblastus sp. 17X3]|uniref:hypothetical protein n=1 Tax=Rhodoblastus sp. 17X3 TaxID=3047026 RepID=UPI0024B7AFFA|nr:hypothetical protein [Rhodoblastus sp. 17X3]MDI9847376.1 hypothetical protein [Rhodoblastus sp. 17X3]